MEMFGLDGAIKRTDIEKLQSHLLSLFDNAIGKKTQLSRSLAIMCGGNAEALSLLASGPQVGGVKTLDLSLLRKRMRDLLRLDIKDRMKSFGVRRDRAEVMGIAAIIFVTLGEWLDLDLLLVPGVGVREGILRDQVVEHFRKEISIGEEAERKLVISARNFAHRYQADIPHAEQVAKL